MIFVTLGTSSFPFGRLVSQIELLSGERKFSDKIILQSGVTSISSEKLVCYPFLSFEKMKNYFQEAEIIITHGGLASIFQAIKWGRKPPIVVPRQRKFREHVDDHQVEFARFLEKKKQIIAVYEIEDLGNIVVNYKKLVSGIKPIWENLSERKRLVRRLIEFTNNL